MTEPIAAPALRQMNGRVVDVPLALAIVGLGIVIIGSPALVPGLTPRM
jgi:hypothetical protein